MMDKTLAAEELWAADGHLSELACAALADGQDALLSPAVFEHAAVCPVCSARVGEAALAALDVQERIEEAARAEQGRFELPLVALVAAAGLVLIGLTPRLLTLTGTAPVRPFGSGILALKGTALLARGAAGESPTMALVWVVLALALVLLGGLVSRVLSLRLEAATADAVFGKVDRR